MFPTELIDYQQWVVWKYAMVDGKFTKQPFSARTGQLASVADPKSWTDYQQACNAVKQHGFEGLGFVLTHNDPYCFIDLDDSQGDAEILRRQIAICETFNSYSEISPSGKGLHIICKAEVPGGRRRNKIEIYSSQRYMTVTGNAYKDLPIAPQQYYAELLWKELDANRGMSELHVVNEPQKYADEEIYSMASYAENGEKFQTLWRGEWQELYNSQSEADFALINIISFYSRNVEQIHRMFRLSELGKREKAKRKGYVEPMIKRSFDNQPPQVDLSDVLQKMANKLGKADAKEEEARVIAASFQGPLFADVPASNIDWTTPPGLLGDIASYIYNSAPRPVKEIALGAAIALMAGVCGRSYNVSGTGLNQYVLILAKTGVGKEAAVGGIDKLMQRVKATVPTAMEYIGPSEIASGQALIKYLDKHPCFLSVVGEFGLALQQMCSPIASPAQKSLRRTLLGLYNKSGYTDIQAGMIYSNKDENISNVKSPAFTLLGEATPETFYSSLDEHFISEGLFPRFLCIEYFGDRQHLNENHLTYEPPNDLIQKMSDLTAQCSSLQHHSKVINVIFDAEAQKMSTDFDHLCTARINTSEQETGRQLWNRAHLKAIKLASLVAIGINPFAPVVNLICLQWAISVVERDVKNVLQKFESGTAGKEFTEINQVTEMVTLIADYVRRPFLGLDRYRVEPEMHKDKVVALSYFQRRLMQKSAFKNDRLGAVNAIARSLKVLCDEGSIQEIRAMDVYKRYGRSAKCYLVVDLTKF